MSNISQVRTASNTEVSAQVFQDVYNTITGKTERLSRVIFHPYEATSENLQSLDALIEQAVEQYNVSASTLNVIVSYSDGKTERHSGMGRFLAQAGTHSSPVEDVTLEYNFLLILPKTHEAKPYKIRVSTRSTVGVVDRLSKNTTSKFERTLFTDLDNATGVVQIMYIDYAVAKTFENHIVGWFDGLPQNPGRNFYRAISMLSGIVSVGVRMASLTLAAFLMVRSLTPSIADLVSLFKVGVIVFTSLVLLNIAVHATLSWVSSLKMHFKPFSFVRLGNADVCAKNRLLKSKVFGLAKILGVYAVAIFLGVFANFVSKNIGL